MKYAVADLPVAFSATAVPVDTIYRANGAYDPVYAMGGGQPRFYDTMLGADGTGAPYYRYTVESCDVQATLTSASGSSTGAHMLVGYRSYDVAAPTTLEDCREFGYKEVNLGYGSGAPSVVTLKTKGDIAKILGKSVQAVQDDDTFSATYNTTPAEEVDIDVVVAPIASTTVTYYLSIVLTYHMVCHQLNHVAAS